MKLEPGAELGQYQIVEEIGRGGMATVFRAHQPSLDRQVAIKVISEALAGKRSFRDRFHREALAVARLRHPNIVAIYDYGQRDELAYFVAELIEGGTLAERLGAPMAPAEVVKLLRPIAAALDHAHSQGVLHRDVKPANILIDKGDRPMLTDFGIARITVHQPRLTLAGGIFGTPEYMAPEQCAGHDVTAAADIYALAAIGYEMLTGRVPHSAASPGAVLAAVMHDPIPPPRSINAAIPETVEAALMRGLASEPRDRFETATHLVDAIAGAVPLAASGSVTSAPSMEFAEVARRGNLPGELTTFIGRENELTELTRLLASSRLITVTGPGGVGKTRIALKLAATCSGGYRDGVWLAELASLQDPNLVPQAVASSLGLREVPGRAISDTLQDHLASRTNLLVLDNCEHLLDACAELATSLLRGCPGLNLIATSRAALGVPGEVGWPVSPMPVPKPEEETTAEQVGRLEAVRLFAQRARLVRPGFALEDSNAATVAEICWRLDGLPLALELAAARLRVLSIAEVAARLGARFSLLTGGSAMAPARQRTLRAAVDWSHDLLSDAERILFRRLSIFAGSCELEAAEAVCGDGGAAFDLLDLLSGLAEKSLLVATADVDDVSRFAMHETLREYGRERLRESGEAKEIAARHASFFLELAERAATTLLGADHALGLSHLDRELDNLRAALRALRDSGRDLDLLRMCAALGEFWLLRVSLREAAEWLEQALEARVDAAIPRAAALWTLSRIRWRQGRLDDAERLAAESLELSRGLGDDISATAALNTLGLVAHNRGDLARARRVLEESLTLARRRGRETDIARALNNLGDVALDENDQATAQTEAHLQEAVSLYRAAMYQRGLAISLTTLGEALLTRGALGAARECFTESLVMRQEARDPTATADGLDGFALQAAAAGDRRRAETLLAAARVLRESIGATPTAPKLARLDRWLRSLPPGLSEDDLERARAAGRNMKLEEAVRYALEYPSEAKADTPSSP